ncbi:MAG: hypothetical protein QXG55_05645 [Thermoplasmata archaeon]
MNFANIDAHQDLKLYVKLDLKKPAKIAYIYLSARDRIFIYYTVKY